MMARRGFLALLLSAVLTVLSPVLPQRRPHGLPPRYKLRESWQWKQGLPWRSSELWRLETVEELYEDMMASLAGVQDGHDRAVLRAISRA